MKILFSNPPWWEVEGRALRQGIRAGSRWPFTQQASFYPDCFRFGGYVPTPYFMQHAAGYAGRFFPDVEIRDSIGRGESYESFLLALKRSTPDYLIVETASSSIDHDERLLQNLHGHFPQMKILLCGTVNPERVRLLLFNEVVTAFLLGEYDKSVVRAIKEKLSGVVQYDLLTEIEMNDSPHPSYDEHALLHYFDANPVGTNPPQLSLWTSRGCPYKCSFCGWPAVMTNHDPDGTKPRRIRHYSKEYVQSYIESMLRVAPFRTIYFDDDTFNIGKDHVLGICEVMRKINRPWSAMCRADTVDKDVWTEMRDSGCFGVKIGFESGSQRVIDKIINKHLNLAEAEETACWLKSIGLSVHGTFTIGLPGETPEEMLETKALIERLMKRKGLDSYQLSGAAEIDGTPMSKIAAGEHLDRYSESQADENYISGKDGVKKADSL